MFATALAALVLLVGLQADGGKPSSGDLASYRQERAKTGRDAQSQVKLALWCEANGLDAERIEHLALAVLTDPTNAAARGLLGLVADSGKWRKPEDVAAKIQADGKLSAALADYAERRARAPKTADGHWRLAIWCEENGLKAEATAHLTACVRLDPSRAAAWKRLGCKKVGGRWVSDSQIAAAKAEAHAQAEADRLYRPLLASWRAGLRDRDENKRFDAEKNLNSLKDPRAARSVWRVFVVGAENPADLNRAVQILGQLDAPLASRGLAMIALDAIDPEVRRAAMETLARRDPRDYMADLIALLRDELRFEVRSVGGPGSLGSLFVEGRQFNRMRLYAPPAANLPNVDPSIGSWTTDADGFAEVHIAGTREDARGSRPVLIESGPGAAVSAQGGQPFTNPSAPSLLMRQPQIRRYRETVDVHSTDTIIPIGRMDAEANRAAQSAQEQLRRDVAVVEGENANIRDRNARVTEILNNATIQVLPPKSETWRSWWADQRGYAYAAPPAVARPTLVENVPLSYTPQPIQPFTLAGGVVGQATRVYQDCFAAGTSVQTRSGARPIESLEIGDSVLAQDMATGALGYKPVLAVFKFRPAETLRITFGGETLLTTAVHRFWRVGEGWVMARDLKPGDVVRGLGGSAKVEAIAKDVVRPVFNLEVAESRDYFVGRAGVLAGDNTLQNEPVTPFDSAARIDRR